MLISLSDTEWKFTPHSSAAREGQPEPATEEEK
jgi:hypothetical protein